MKTWEYKTITRDRWDGLLTTAELNVIGSQGWELVTIYQRINSYVYMLKREMGDSESGSWVFRSMHQRFDKIEQMLHKLHEEVGTGMATLVEVRASMDAMQATVAETNGRMESAVVLLHEIADRLRNAAATEMDLTGLKDHVDAMAIELDRRGDELAAALETVPADEPAEGPQP